MLHRNVRLVLRKMKSHERWRGVGPSHLKHTSARVSDAQKHRRSMITLHTDNDLPVWENYDRDLFQREGIQVKQVWPFFFFSFSIEDESIWGCPISNTPTGGYLLRKHRRSMNMVHKVGIQQCGECDKMCFFFLSSFSFSERRKAFSIQKWVLRTGRLWDCHI